MIKSVVLPFEVFDKMNSASGFSNNKNEMLETELRRVLDDKKLEPDEKRLMYSQLLHKYVKSVQDLRSDVVLPVNNAEDEPTLTTDAADQAQTRVNKGYERWADLLNSATNKLNAKSAANLFNYIQGLPSVSIDSESGEISIKGVRVKNSNIVDLILHLATRPLTIKKSKGDSPQSIPIGTYNLLQHLKANNIPQTFIKNTVRYNEPQPDSLPQPLPSSPPSGLIPIVLSSKIKSKRLKRFTPYKWEKY